MSYTREQIEAAVSAIKVSCTEQSTWPTGKPISSETLENGKVKHTLEDGRSMTVSKPTYRLYYLSTWHGAQPGETYEVNIALAGLSSIKGFYTTWNFDIGERRDYRFDKTVQIVHLRTGVMLTGAELEVDLVKQNVLAY